MSFREARAGIEPANSGFAVPSGPLRDLAPVCIRLRIRVLRSAGLGCVCVWLRAFARVCAQNRAHAAKAHKSATTNAAGSAIVNVVGPIRQFARDSGRTDRRYLVIVPVLRRCSVRQCRFRPAGPADSAVRHAEAKHHRDPRDRRRADSAHVAEPIIAVASVAIGNEKWNVAPRPSFTVAQIRPPCDSMIERLIDSPMPLPCGFVVKKASKI
jgi:hypothetical protein